MYNMLEKNVQSKLISQLQKRGCLIVKNTVTNLPGWPDLSIYAPDGFHFLVEVKAEGKKPSPRQEARIRQLLKVGAIVYTYDGTDKDFVNKVLGEENE